MCIKPQKILFILGRGRSGTTLLSSLLNSNDQICVAPECVFAMNLANKYQGVKFDLDILGQFCSDIFLEKRIKNWSFNKNKLMVFLTQKLEPGASFSQAVKAVYSAHAYFSGKRSAVFLGDKNPHYALFSKRLFNIFPDAYWIHIVRDPRATVASYKRVRFDYSNAAILAGRWNEYNENILNADLWVNNRYLFVRYEDLLEKPEHTTNKILDFLTIDKIENRKVSLSVEQHLKSCPWHQKLKGDFDQSRVTAWSTELKVEDIKTTEKICHRLMDKFDYKPRYAITAKDYAFHKAVSASMAKGTVLLEKLLFIFPLTLRSVIITIYRRLSGSL